MRTKIIFPIIFFAGVVLLLAGWLRPRPASPAASVPATATMASARPDPSSLAATFKDSSPSVPLAPPAGAATDNSAAAPEVQDADDRCAGLAMLAMNDDADSLHFILGSLNDPDPQIRAAARDAAVQFHSPDAIPALQAALAKAELPQEKTDIQGAIDFLHLPSLAQAETKKP